MESAIERAEVKLPLSGTFSTSLSMARGSSKALCGQAPFSSGIPLKSAGFCPCSAVL